MMADPKPRDEAPAGLPQHQGYEEVRLESALPLRGSSGQQWRLAGAFDPGTLDIIRPLGPDSMIDSLSLLDLECNLPRILKTGVHYVESEGYRHFKLTKHIHSGEWQVTIRQYKKSVIQKSMFEWIFLSNGRMPLAALYTEPVLIQKNKSSGFENISVEQLIRSNKVLNGPITVTLQGNSGSGKSFLAQKIMLDWACGKLYTKEFHLVFCLKCEELKCISEEVSLIELLSWSCSLTSDQILYMLQNSLVRVLFIIDGFDELRLTSDEYHMSSPTDKFQKAPPEVILCSLLNRSILPQSYLLVTTRTKATQYTLLEGAQCFSKILGFYECAVKEYFQKFFQDEELFRKSYECVKANETLFTACSIPVICWIICTVIRERTKYGADVTSGLETTTSMYVDFVSTLLEHHSQGLSQSVPTLLRSLGQLAERGMLEQRVLFDEKTVNEVSDPSSSPFLCKKTIHHETMFGFMHLSFQEFFTALYYVFLDEEESQRKVRELLHTVERGWALSYWSVEDFSITGLKIRSSKLLQPVILFLCGLYNKELCSSFFKKHKLSVCLNIDTQLKDWIHQCSLRYQSEHMLFILYCLYELHEKSFTKKVLENLILIDLSNTPLKRTDCWVLLYCLQCCTKIRHLILSVSSDNLRMLQSELCRCEELWLMMDHISDDIGHLISAVGEETIVNELIIKVDKIRSFRAEIIMSVKDGDVTFSVSCSKKRKSLQLLSELTLTCPRPEISTVNWTNFLQRLHSLPKFNEQPQGSYKEVVSLLSVLHSVSGLKKVHLQVVSLTDKWATSILPLIQACPNLRELRINATFSILLEEIQSLTKLLKQSGWTLTIWRKSALIKQDRKSFKEEELKTGKREKTKRRLGQSLDSASYSMLGAESSLTEQSSTEDAEVFTPQQFKGVIEDKGKNTHRFVCPHAGQFRCSLTNLVFVMEGKGEILYNIVPWDPRLLDGLGQRKPAGPLYNIDCVDGSTSQLHLPHCEPSAGENKGSLAVAHITGDNVEVLRPQKVTETHVTIDIGDLSLFGLIKKMIFPASPVCAQVLLFLRPITLKQKKLNVHLLPGNVPLSEVQSQHQEKIYIETSSICHLIPGREYSLCCSPEECEVQPPGEVFQCNFGPNYHPTFEMFLDVNMEEVRLGLLDKTEEGNEVWKQRRVLLAASDSECIKPPHRMMSEEQSESEFVDKLRDKLIQRVTSVKEIVDCLRSKDMITDELWSEIHAAKTQQKQMRILYKILDSKGSAVKAKFYRLLKEKEPDLVDELESGPSKAL